MASTVLPRLGTTARSVRFAQRLCVVGLLASLAACGHSGNQTADIQINEARQYQAHARGDYTPPGPPEDPWGPYIAEASKRFDVPDRWIREVMRQESGGHLFRNGELITSWVGAMGLMQVMPQTYDGLKARYNLDDDAFDPHNNILAGTAYIREMYDMYGSPGFLAAYNAGPRRLDDYLANTRPLPAETRHYVAAIGPYIEGIYPNHRSPAEDYAMNQITSDIPPGLRYGHATATADDGGSGNSDSPQIVHRVARALQHLGRLDFAEVAEPSHHYVDVPEPMPRRFASAGRDRSVAPEYLASNAVPVSLVEPSFRHHGGRGSYPIQLGAYGAESVRGYEHSIAPRVDRRSAEPHLARVEHCAKKHGCERG